MKLNQIAHMCAHDESGNLRVSYDTIRIYKSTAARLIEYFGSETAVREITLQDLKDWQQWIDNRPQSNTVTDNTYKRTARAMFNYLRQIGVDVCQTPPGFWHIRKQRKKLKSISDRNAYTMLAYSGLRDAALLYLAMDSARRRGGLADLQLKNLKVWYDDEIEEYCVIGKVREKGDKPQILLAGHEAAITLLSWLHVRKNYLKKMNVEDHGYVFINLRDGRPLRPDSLTGIVNSIRKKAQIPTGEPASLHAFRHKRAKELLKYLSLPEVRDILGHEESSTTADIYATNDEDELTRAFFTRARKQHD